MSSELPPAEHGDTGTSRRVAAARARMATGDWPSPLAVADAVLASGLLSLRWRSASAPVTSS